MLFIDDVEVRPIKGFEGLYSASSDGRVWSHAKKMGDGHHNGRWLKAGMSPAGYRMVVLLAHPIRTTRTVHRLVAETWLGAAPGLEVNHKNGIKTDNRLENLEWVSRSQNLQHAWDMGLRARRNANRILSAESAQQIRNDFRAGARQIDLAKVHGVSKHVIGDIVHNRTYAN